MASGSVLLLSAKCSRCPTHVCSSFKADLGSQDCIWWIARNILEKELWQIGPLFVVHYMDHEVVHTAAQFRGTI